MRCAEDHAVSLSQADASSLAPLGCQTSNLILYLVEHLQRTTGLYWLDLVGAFIYFSLAALAFTHLGLPQFTGTRGRGGPIWIVEAERNRWTLVTHRTDLRIGGTGRGQVFVEQVCFCGMMWCSIVLSTFDPQCSNFDPDTVQAICPSFARPCGH